MSSVRGAFSMDAGHNVLSDQRTGIYLYMLGMLFMSVMDASAKWLTDGYAIVQLVFFQSFFALVPAIWALRNEQPQSVAPRRWPLLMLRSLIAVGIISCFFWALKFLPLAEVAAIFAVAPLLMTVLSGLVLKEHIGFQRWGAVLLGLLGAVIIIRPGGLSFGLVALLPVGAAVCYAVAAVLSRILVQTERSSVIVTCQYATVMVLSGMLLPLFWVTPTLGDVAVFLVLGITGGLGGYCRVRASRHAAVNVLSPFDYTALVWAALFGYLFWAEVPDLWTWLGAAAICAGGIYVVRHKGGVSDAKSA